MKLRTGNEEEDRKRVLLVGVAVSVGIHLFAFAYGNLIASGAGDSGTVRTPSATQVELVARVPEPPPPPPPVVRPPPPRPIPLAKTQKIEGVPQPKPSEKIEPPTPPPVPEPPQPQAKAPDSIASGGPAPGMPGPGDMISPIPATGGGGSGPSVSGRPNSTTPGTGTTTALKGNASFTSAAPDYLHNPAPEYPEDARMNRQQGVVILLVDVSPEGAVLKVSLQRSSGYRKLDEAALRVAKDWKFKPGTAGGQPIRSQVEVPVRFRLQ